MSVVVEEKLTYIEVYRKISSKMEDVISGEYNWMGKGLQIKKKNVYFQNRRYDFEKITPTVYMSKIEGIQYIFMWDIDDEILQVVAASGEPRFIDRISPKQRVFTTFIS